MMLNLLGHILQLFPYKSTISSVHLPKGPIWSNDEAKAIKPYLETLPYVGLNPEIPQKLAGSLMEPPYQNQEQQ